MGEEDKRMKRQQKLMERQIRNQGANPMTKPQGANPMMKPQRLEPWLQKLQDRDPHPEYPYNLKVLVQFYHQVQQNSSLPIPDVLEILYDNLRKFVGSKIMPAKYKDAVQKLSINMRLTSIYKAVQKLLFDPKVRHELDHQTFAALYAVIFKARLAVTILWMQKLFKPGFGETRTTGRKITDKTLK